MRLLILGGNGMLGHKLWQTARETHDVFVTMRSAKTPFDGMRIVPDVDASHFDSVRAAIESVKPDAIVNCIGIVKQLAEAKQAIPSITINSLLPHRLAELGIRLVHLSTDCVFSGRKGGYVESDFADAGDLYGRTKYLGEVDAPKALTIRTSIIGRELAGTSGLVEWFLSNRGGRVKGFRKMIFSGLTTAALSRVILRAIDEPTLTGVWHVSAAPIDKDTLLRMLNDAFRAGIDITPADDVVLDRSLDSSRFRAAFGWEPPTWEKMIDEMASDPTPYDEWRSSDVLRR